MEDTSTVNLFLVTTVSLGTCPVCGKEIQKGEDIFIDSNGTRYHLECARQSLKEFKKAEFAGKVRAVVRMKLIEAVKQKVIDYVKANYADVLKELGITDEELEQIIERVF